MALRKATNFNLLLRNNLQFINPLYIKGNLSCAICLVLIPWVGCNSGAAIALLLLGMYLCVCGVSGGEFAIVAEYAPNYSGTVFGVSNTLASSTGFIGPQVSGFLLDQVVSSMLFHLLLFS